jgi:hypothetical protein
MWWWRCGECGRGDEENAVEKEEEEGDAVEVEREAMRRMRWRRWRRKGMRWRWRQVGPLSSFSIGVSRPIIFNSNSARNDR